MSSVLHLDKFSDVNSYKFCSTVTTYNPECSIDSEDLTTVLGIKNKEGIIIASDSQFTGLDGKEFGSKIFKINNSMILGISGRMDQMAILIEKLEQKFCNKIFDKKEVESVMLKLHKEYNIRWTNELGKDTTIFNPQSLLGVRTKDGEFELYRILFDPDPWLESIEFYKTIGSGQQLANLVVKQQDRIIKAMGDTFRTAPMPYCIFIACSVMNEVKANDAFSSGTTQMALVNKDKIAFSNKTEIENFYNIMITSISSALSKALSSSGEIHIPEDVMRKTFPEDNH